MAQERKVLQQEGFVSLWKGNVLNCSRIVPYSALQFGTYDLCKSVAFEEPLTVPQRLACGSAAGFVATTATHPIDVIRHRLLMNADIHTFGQAARDIFAEQGARSLFKGYGYETKFISVNHRKRHYGTSNYGTFKRLINGIKDMIKVKKILKNYYAIIKDKKF